VSTPAAATLVQRVFNALADGALHSGEQLAAGHGVTRSAVWKAVGALQELGVAIEATPNRGYRLAASIVGDATGATDEDPEPDDPYEGKDPAAVALGRKGGLKGGKARAAAMTKRERSAVAKKAARARWGKLNCTGFPGDPIF